MEARVAPAGQLRWDLADAPKAQGALFDEPVFEREPGKGEFRGMEFLHVRARTIINRVPGPPRFGFAHTINAYRGCSHACSYCFARPTHAYLDLGIDEDFERKIVVKVNAVERLRVELDPRRWAGDLIAMGTNTDPYQRCEGKYRLTQGLIEVLTERANPFSILTKSTLILRDLDLLVDAVTPHRGPRQPVDRHPRRGRVAGDRARHAASSSAHAGRREAQRRRRAVRRAGGPDPARALRSTRADRGRRAGRLAAPAPSRSTRPCSICAPA